MASSDVKRLSVTTASLWGKAAKCAATAAKCAAIAAEHAVTAAKCGADPKAT